MRIFWVSVLEAFVFITSLVIGIGVLVGVIAAIVCLPMGISVLLLTVGMILESVLIVFWLKFDDFISFVDEKLL